MISFVVDPEVAEIIIILVYITFSHDVEVQ